MLNTIKNPYVSVAMTDDLRDNFIEAYNANKPNIPERIKILAENKFKSDIQLEDILWLKKKLPKDVRIYKLLENCDVKLPAPELEPRNPELEARIQKLKVLEEERRYQDMTRNVDTSRVRHPEDSIAYQSSCTTFMCLPFLSKNYITSWFQSERDESSVDRGSTSCALD
ncbi:uncharacterized protein LOC135847258 isoform X2 [Planococcus citri]|uniref:uncharacterized protein LOC135847258 isoform X2 n=1 Tax=Planococcus citri TaxID=170843 RepID=UPI0031F85471